MRWDFFHKAESNNKSAADKPLTPYIFDLPDNTTLPEALQHAYDNGMPRGSARAGCVEIQTDKGIYTHKRGMRIDVSTPRKAANVVFKTWEELEEEDDGTLPVPNR